MGSRGWKYLIGYAAWREWRWGKHSEQVWERQHPNAAGQPLGYFGLVSVGVVMTLLGLPILWLFWGIGFLVAWWFMCEGVVLLWTIAGIMARYKDLHR